MINSPKRHIAPDSLASNGAPRHPTLDTMTQERIGARLRELYDHLAEQPIPAFLLDILERPSNVRHEITGRGRVAENRDPAAKSST